ncbi:MULTISPECIES: lipid IV(A) palmitoyltransferase PagP [Providencia]|uniref:Lipid A acyltransferase PagP n=3 Tax=Providencia TaxID=586 RepID=A0AAI9HWG8_PROST|nr:MULTISPECIES: lipid IV(A) palmitoyltransferase PagP [Providencia]ELR5033919.1 lipid IV(A) palmitoyltransferase PagP [Providencia stuartii]ELR5045711.1 lipid IV(A) palmitoyltransferase PagP [Providencia rettgeri]ELR5119715.1 lipid IV(A) palmitoyltransferase PagP [Providencia stuartii]ELR5141459.1 lipid IV(A) palmitoyltransferase PagP [Providencia stuartii]ELR5290817.1 lipid IV(A) palmitoyltransferase PagP [Providencia stuartii]
MRVNKKLQQVVGASALMMTSICFASSTNTAQESEGLWDKFTRNVSTTWDSDQYDIYIPVLTWHNRFTYDKEKTDSYNENPWGFGLGKYRYDEDNDWHALYAMAFMDSHNKVEPIAGYAFQKMWIPGELDGFKMGAGFTLSVTARDDYYYIPLPLPLPLVSMEYDRLAVQATYIPGTHNNGNVLFAWLRWQW